jgi:hypothetical protein
MNKIIDRLFVNPLLDLLIHVGVAFLFVFETYRIIMDVPSEGDVESAVRMFIKVYGGFVALGWLVEFMKWLGIWPDKTEDRP